MLDPFLPLASAADLSPSLSGISKDFSERFCASIGNGMTPQKAGEVSAVQLSKGLLFSSALKEITSAPKETLVESLSNNIFVECGDDLGDTKGDIDSYLSQLVKKIPRNSSYSLQLPPTQQKPYK
ncbi:MULTISPECIES: hypothetical protein [unclassified Prochlorococcus]|uniref:hypothetical protein n=1 Tax=unclassified Prochlorococcus TaxID=2627481 RepID=UPI001268F743|nr:MULTISPECIES: hypothetical protein [unclassified Prochlorococcus]